ncbi:MAG TPA: class IV lanthionine synthetase LanL [Acidimicrobiia bacterium]
MEVRPLDASPLVGDLAVTARDFVAASGAEWKFSVEGPWAFATPIGAQSPEQGWKLHISATETSAAEVLAATLPVLVTECVPFKFAATHKIVRLLNSTHADRASGGKFITVYPADEEQAVRVAEACHRATEGLTGPVILSDRAYRPGSLVHYRYGGFTGSSSVDADGVVIHLIKGPDGTPLADERTASYRAPSWLADPFQPAAATAVPTSGTAPSSGGTVVLNGRYRIHGALSHANKGGTYLAEDATTGRMVVIKEGRPHVGDEGRGDARARVRHEARMLSLVESALGGSRRLCRGDTPHPPGDLAPRLVDLFEQGGHVFLVEQYIDAPSLRELVEGDTGEGPVTALPADEIRALAIALAETMAAFHADGIVVGDFNPNNILVNDDGSLVLIDLEHARPAAEPQGSPAGTPGYASEEQLRGTSTDGYADDSWSLGATIAFLATGADPFLPAGADDTWSEPARLAAWLDGQVAAGAVDAALAGIALGAMAPRPTDRLRPAAVLTALRGEGSRMAPGRGGSSDGAPTETDIVAQAADVVVDLAAWLVETMGAGPAGHLWPAGAAAASLDPIAVQAGASGVGLFLAQLVRAAGDLPAAAQRRLEHIDVRHTLSQTAAWVADQLARNPERPPGLYFGTSGVAWFLADAGEALGRDDLLRRAHELALTIPVRVPNSDITHGTAGIGFGQLRQWLSSGDERFLARAVVAAEQVLRSAVRSDDGSAIGPVPVGAPPRLAGTVSYGYAHGNAGIATFLFAIAAATGEPEFAAMGSDALLTVLPHAVAVDGAAYWPASPEHADESSEAGYWPSWCNGSTGIGTAFLRAHLYTGEPGFRLAADAAALAGLRERWRSSAVQCHGLAGDAELILDLMTLPARELEPGDPYRRAALEAAEALLLQRRTPAGAATSGTVFADDSGGTISAGFGTGLAGTGAFLLRLVAGGARPLLLDDLLTFDGGEA